MRGKRLFLFAFILVALSAGLYYWHYLTFQDKHHIFIYLLGDIAFIPLEVLFVTLIIHRVLDNWDKRHKVNKSFMVIDTFYSVIGQDLLRLLIKSDVYSDKIKDFFINIGQWNDKTFKIVINNFKRQDYRIDSKQIRLGQLRDFCLSHREFLLRLLENPSVLEQDEFAQLLRALFHLTDELAQRKDLLSLSLKDGEHFDGDIRRVYRLLVSQWLFYMRHLNKDYPYLFSLACRLNPFVEVVKAEIE